MSKKLTGRALAELEANLWSRQAGSELLAGASVGILRV